MFQAGGNSVKNIPLENLDFDNSGKSFQWFQIL